MLARPSRGNLLPTYGAGPSGVFAQSPELVWSAWHRLASAMETRWNRKGKASAPCATSKIPRLMRCNAMDMCDSCRPLVCCIHPMQSLNLPSPCAILQSHLRLASNNSNARGMKVAKWQEHVILSVLGDPNYVNCCKWLVTIQSGQSEGTHVQVPMTAKHEKLRLMTSLQAALTTFLSDGPSSTGSRYCRSPGQPTKPWHVYKTGRVLHAQCSVVCDS